MGEACGACVRGFQPQMQPTCLKNITFFPKCSEGCFFLNFVT